MSLFWIIIASLALIAICVAIGVGIAYSLMYQVLKPLTSWLR